MLKETEGTLDNDVLEDGSEADGAVNVWLLLSRETNALGIAATLNVEDTSVTPAVLVVTDQGTLGVGRQSGLAGSGKTEENSNILVLDTLVR